MSIDLKNPNIALHASKELKSILMDRKGIDALGHIETDAIEAGESNAWFEGQIARLYIMCLNPPEDNAYFWLTVDMFEGGIVKVGHESSDESEFKEGLFELLTGRSEPFEISETEISDVIERSLNAAGTVTFEE